MFQNIRENVLKRLAKDASEIAVALAIGLARVMKVQLLIVESDCKSFSDYIMDQSDQAF